MLDREMDYLKRAMAALEDPELTPMTRQKILQTMSEVAGRAAQDIRNQMITAVEDRLYGQGPA